MGRNSAKERHTVTILEYLGDPDNDWPTRSYLATEVCKYKRVKQLYAVFTVDELNELEKQALEFRRKKYAGSLAEVDQGLMKAAQEGNPAAAKLVYQRFEGWVESAKIELDGKPLVVINDSRGKATDTDPS